ncbi:MAG: hypothetical protein ACK51A_10040, partial [Sphingobacteriia bacterium]
DECGFYSLVCMGFFAKRAGNGQEIGHPDTELEVPGPYSPILCFVLAERLSAGRISCLFLSFLVCVLSFFACLVPAHSRVAGGFVAVAVFGAACAYAHA